MKTFLSKIQRDKWPLAGLLAGSGVLAWMMELDLRSLGASGYVLCVGVGHFDLLGAGMSACAHICREKAGHFSLEIYNGPLSVRAGSIFSCFCILCLVGGKNIFCCYANFAVGICLCRGECHRVMERHSNGLYPLYPLVGMCRGGDMGAALCWAKNICFPRRSLCARLLDGCRVYCGYICGDAASVCSKVRRRFLKYRPGNGAFFIPADGIFYAWLSGR